VPDEARARIDRALEPYRRASPGVRWLQPSTWHVTLVFVGSVRVAALDELTRACDAAAAVHAPFALGLAGGGGRVGRDGGVAWLAVARNAGCVIDLADTVRHAMPGGIAGGREPRRAPSAHLTVARRAERGLVGALRDEANGPLRATWEVDRIALMRSHLGRDGARYELVHDAPLQLDVGA
jgi:2'-5' RNA ligase